MLPKIDLFTLASSGLGTEALLVNSHSVHPHIKTLKALISPAGKQAILVCVMQFFLNLCLTTEPVCDYKLYYVSFTWAPEDQIIYSLKIVPNWK